MNRPTNIALALEYGRASRRRGIDIQTTNVNLARELGWRTRADFDDAILDACEDGWRDIDETLSAPDQDFE